MTRKFAKSSQGFTLLELLIALAVTSAVVALMFAGVGVIGRSEERNQRVIERSERMLVVSQWLGRKFDTLRLLSRRSDTGFVNFFSGNAAGLLWVAPLPERGEGGGLYVFRMTPLRHAMTVHSWTSTGTAPCGRRCSPT
jgi:general secretion pathway protein J